MSTCAKGYCYLNFEGAQVLHPFLFDVSDNTFWILCYDLSKVRLLLRQILRFNIGIACILIIQQRDGSHA